MFLWHLRGARSSLCSNCGAPASDPESTRIARMQSSAIQRGDDDDLEHVVFTVRPTMIFIKAGYALAVLGGIAVVFLLAPRSAFGLRIQWRLRSALLLIPAYYHIRRNMIRYTVTDSKQPKSILGLVACTTRNVRSARCRTLQWPPVFQRLWLW